MILDELKLLQNQRNLIYFNRLNLSVINKNEQVYTCKKNYIFKKTRCFILKLNRFQRSYNGFLFFNQNFKCLYFKNVQSKVSSLLTKKHNLKKFVLTYHHTLLLTLWNFLLNTILLKIQLLNFNLLSTLFLFQIIYCTYHL